MDYIGAYILFWFVWCIYHAVKKIKRIIKDKAAREKEDEENLDKMLKSLNDIVCIGGAKMVSGPIIALSLILLMFDLAGMWLSYGYFNFSGIELAVFVIIACAVFDEQRVFFNTVMGVAYLATHNAEDNVQKRYLKNKRKELIPQSVSVFGKLYLAILLVMHVILKIF